MKLCLFNVENLFISSINSPYYLKKAEDKTLWIARTIEEIDADISMLCEVGGMESLEILNYKFLNSKYNAVLLKGNSDRGIEMGYLIKKNLPFNTELISHANESIDFNYPHEIEANKKTKVINSKIPPHKYSRDLSELRIFKDGNLALILLLVHLKSKWDRDGYDFNGCLRRKAEFNAAIKTYQKLNSDYNGHIPIILAGDMNGVAQANLFEPEFEELYKSTELQDVLEIIKEPLENRNTFFYFNKENRRESFQLDYIFLPPVLQKLVTKADSGIYRFRDQYGNVVPTPQDSYQRYALPSDHYPLVVSLNFL